MPATQSVQNNFTKGLLTEFTGLNFPENAATDTDNCVYTITGDVTRRLGVNFETNYVLGDYNRSLKAINTYKWNNAGGDGTTQVYVGQIGSSILFWSISSSTIASPLSSHLIGSTVLLTDFAATGATVDIATEAQFSDGNGYLFIYHPDCDPIYCTYSAGTITGNRIAVQIRDFQGVVDGFSVNVRPTTLSDAHLYNLSNQGWTQGSPWIAQGTNTWSIATGSKVFTVPAGITGTTIGDQVTITDTVNFTPTVVTIASGNLTAYAGTSMTINVTSVNGSYAGHTSTAPLISPSNHGYITTWFSGLGNYPSNADVWWTFKNSSDVFAPSTTISNVPLNIGNAPKGHFVIDAFDQQRDNISAIPTITDVVTIKRPRTGTWFQGRVWYAGCDSSQAASGTANQSTWTENIYFSQIITDVSKIGYCYQTNDPTSQTLFDILPTDGGVIQIQGCGSVYKLFPIQNGMLVFAANGIWFITGSQGIGFSANDYTITKISAIQSISSTSFVDVNGLPYFWNEEGIYAVQPAKNGGLEVNPLTVGTILSFYNSIPKSSKKYVRGAYHPIDYVVQWIYKGTEETSVTDRYQFNKILNFNTYNKAFFPYSVSIADTSINSITYIAGPGGSTSVAPCLKYMCSYPNAGSFKVTFALEQDTSYADWVSKTSTNYSSYFVTGYRLAGKSLLKFQPVYVYMYSNNLIPTMYRIQGLWDYANSGASGRYSSYQKTVINNIQYAGVQFRKHKIRGRGMALQIKITSVDGQPFDIVGWSSWEMVNAGI